MTRPLQVVTQLQSELTFEKEMSSHRWQERQWSMHLAKEVTGKLQGKR
jgi:hypothetical protein